VVFKQASSRFCFVCGVENPWGLHLSFTQTASGEVVADFVAPETYQGYPGIVHGGIVAAMLDEIAGRALMGDDPASPRFMFTARLELRYRRNVPIGKPLHLVGKALKKKDRTALASAQLFGPDGSLLAEAEALLVDVLAQVVADTSLEELGWKVYPDDPPVMARQES
jgi:acyl-coenzyme A thioesterase PaaI-like protein